MTCRVRILKPWKTYNPGDEIPELPRSSAELLVDRGVAEYVDEHVHRAPVDRMLRSRRNGRHAEA